MSGQGVIAYVSKAAVGDLIRVKGNPKNRSPFVVVREFNKDGAALVENIDAPGNGNRRQRRAKWRQMQKGK